MLFEGLKLDIFWAELYTVIVEADFAESNSMSSFNGGLCKSCEGGEGLGPEGLSIAGVDADCCVDCVC